MSKLDVFQVNGKLETLIKEIKEYHETTIKLLESKDSPDKDSSIKDSPDKVISRSEFFAKKIYARIRNLKRLGAMIHIDPTYKILISRYETGYQESLMKGIQVNEGIVKYIDNLKVLSNKN